MFWLLQSILLVTHTGKNVLFVVHSATLSVLKPPILYNVRTGTRLVLMHLVCISVHENNYLSSLHCAYYQKHRKVSFFKT